MDGASRPNNELDNYTQLVGSLIHNFTTMDTMDRSANYMITGRSMAWIVVDAVILVFLMLVTIVGNFVVIRAILTFRQLKEHHSNWFIVNLAIADLLVNFVSLLSLVALCADSGQSTPIFGTILCNIQCAMNYCLIVASMVTLAFISLDRLVHILYPLRYLDIINNKCIAAMLVWPWVQGLCIGITPWIEDWIHYDYYELVCAIDWLSENALTYVTVAFITCFMIPLITLVCSYSLIVKEITRRGLDKCYAPPVKKANILRSCYPVYKFALRNEKVSSKSVPGTAGQHKKIIHSLLVVVAVFILCMTPFCVTKVIKVSGLALPGWVSTMATYVQLAASACNPFIYGIFRKEFRLAFRKQYSWLLGRSKCVKPSNRSITLHSVIQQEPSVVQASQSTKTNNLQE